MRVCRAAVLVFMLAILGHPVFAQADHASAGAQHAAPRRSRARVVPRPERPGHLLSDFIRGTPAQQELERRDNDLATMRPVDHRKDDFFSDWRGVR